MAAQAKEYLQRVGLEVAPHANLATLSTAARQLVEVAKALSTGASIVIMDEPTSSLSTTEADRLFEVVQTLRDDGVSVVYISHRLGEVVRLADRVEVMRDGKNAGSLVGSQINHNAMVSAMVGREVDRLYDRSPHPPGDVRLTVQDFRVESDSEAAVSLQVRAGEVVGIAGLVGSGRSELLEAIFGVRRPASGTVRVNETNVRLGSVHESIHAGLALVPEDRKRTGLLIESSVRENATLAAMQDAKGSPWLRRSWQTSATSDVINKLSVKTASQETTIANLSGGNQQKIALGKWLMCEPQVLMLDEPTRGVDVGAKEEIYALLDRLSGEGLAVLFVSSEIEELLAIADRVLVMHEGCISGELTHDELDEEAIMRLAVGLSEPVVA
jgi:ribose transport system ATP-binding protein